MEPAHIQRVKHLYIETDIISDSPSYSTHLGSRNIHVNNFYHIQSDRVIIMKPRPPLQDILDEWNMRAKNNEEK